MLAPVGWVAVVRVGFAGAILVALFTRGFALPFAVFAGFAVDGARALTLGALMQDFVRIQAAPIPCHSAPSARAMRSACTTAMPAWYPSR